MAIRKKSSSLIELQAQIAALQKRAAEVRSKQYKKALGDIIALMKAFGIPFEEVKGAAADVVTRVRAGKRNQRRGRPAKLAQKKASTRIGKKSGKTKSSRRPAPVKYKGPGGETWSGRGKQPVWLRSQIDSGRKLEDFKV